ncbi:MAG: hypothetical protein IJG64_01340 [Oscillospiraceae bacterium]|nr:hypothetical protein [Oscillospiraceae bacterium]
MNKGDIIDTGNPHQNLANAIVTQAAQDWKSAVAYLKDHKETPELLSAVEERKAERARLVEEWVANRKKEKLMTLADPKGKTWEDMTVSIPKMIGERLLPYSKDELLLAKIKLKRDEIKDIEAWFHTNAFSTLTDLNPDYLIKLLRKEAEIAEGDI